MLADLDALEIHAIAVDSKDRVYAATSPDGKVYRITGNGKPEVFYDPKAKYIWAMAFDSKGDLFVATGDQGEIHRVTPDGKGKVFFKSDETHVRSMAIDAERQPDRGHRAGRPGAAGFAGGRGLRAVPDGEARSDRGGGGARRVDLRGGGGRPSRPRPRSRAAPPRRRRPAPATVTVNAPGAPGAARRPERPVAPPPSLGAGGGERRQRSVPHRAERQSAARVEHTRRTWCTRSRSTRAGRVLLGAGNKGNVYRIESPTRYTALLTMPATQITAFQTGHERAALRRHGQRRARSTRSGRSWRSEGTIESDVFDASMYTLWGRLSFEAQPERRHDRDRDAQRQSRSAAEELEPVVVADHVARRAGAWHRRRRASCSGRRR